MRDYGKVHTSFWSSETLRGLDADAKLLALYLLTSTHTHQAGVFRLPNAYAADDLGWDSERLAKGYETLSAANWLRRCARTGWVWVINFAKFNPPDNPNQRKSVEKQLSSVPASCSFFSEMQTVEEPLPNGSGNGCLDSNNPPSPVPVPSPVPASKKKKASEVTLTAWIDGLGGAEAVAADDPLFQWAKAAGIPREWIALAWWAFEARYGEGGKDAAKRYTDWRSVFRTAVKEDWLRVWRNGRDGWELTTAGVALQREMRS